MQPPLPGRRHLKVWQGILGVLIVLALLTVCGLTTFFIVKDEKMGTDAHKEAAAAPRLVARDISSREVDPAPLTLTEVYPSKQVAIVAGQPAYQVLNTQENRDCRVAAAGDLQQRLAAAGCSQVVRATLRSPTGEYLITAGIFNLASEAAAEQVRGAVKPLVDAEGGRFTGLIAGKGSEPIVLSSTHLGWDVRGHYLIYSVIARADGKRFVDGDPYAKQIIYDMIVLHLRDTVLEKRATIEVGPGQATTPAAGPTPSIAG